MKSHWMTVGLIAGLVLVQTADAAVIALSSVKDNTLYQDAAGALSNGAGEFFFAGQTSMNLTRRGLIAFDIDGSIPAGTVINSVSLTLHLSQTSAGTNSVALHNVLSDWGEGSSDAAGGEGGGIDSTPNDATWIHTFFNTSLWTNPGGDFNLLASATLSIAGVNSYTWSSSQMTADVQQWLDNPTTDFGWLLKGNESAANTTKRFDTRENLEAAFRPMLLIDYTPIPGPGTVMVFALMMMKTRRRTQ